MKPGTGNSNKWYRKFRSFQYEREKGTTSKDMTFFPENFLRDEPFHLNSPRNFLVFHTNRKRSRSCDLYRGSRGIGLGKQSPLQFGPRAKFAILAGRGR